MRDARRRRWLVFDQPVDVICARSVADVISCLAAVEKAVNDRGLWAAGYVGYEAAPAFDRALVTCPDAGFPPLWFGLYAPPRRAAMPKPSSGYPDLCDWQSSVDPEGYRAAVRRIKDYIRAGDTYQVNYTIRLRTAGVGDPAALFARMIAAQTAPYGALVCADGWIICSASPELFFRQDGDTIVSRPMKGTAARGLSAAQDLRQAAILRADPKNRAENVMIVDMVRNDLGRVAVPGSVRASPLFTVERYPTLWQMTSSVRARTTASLVDIFRATFPPASITGAPKNRTMAIIAELEGVPRRIYTGAIGFIAPNRQAQLNVAIRTVLIDSRTGVAEYGVGGGIVWDSEAASEAIECRTKALILDRVPEPFELLETMLWVPREGFRLLDRHLGRLAESARYFGFRANPGRIRNMLAVLATGFRPEPMRVRLILKRNGKFKFETQPFSMPADDGPLRVALAPDPIDASDVFLYHKTTKRDVYRKALEARPGYQDVILWNARREATESTIANLVVEIDGVHVTPPVESGLLGGTFRAELLKRREIYERVVTLDALRGACRVWLINSVRGRYPVAIDFESNAQVLSGFQV